MATEVEVAVLRRDVDMNSEVLSRLGGKIDALDDKIGELNVSLARYQGMIGWIMMIGTAVVAAVKLTLSYFK